MSLFADIVGQELALTILRRSLATGPAHAYLFWGPLGVGKEEAAYEFAAGLCCAVGGCGQCDTCRRVREGIHPDVEVLAPEGAFITVDQIREVNRDVALRPFESRARVYILLDAHSMNKEAANAFLKTLEEPPGHAHFILVTSAAEALLPTILSRCQRVPFSRVGAPVLARHLTACCGLSELEALAYARVAQGSVTYACELAQDAGARAQRERLIGWARRIPTDSPLEMQHMADEIFTSVEGRAEAKLEAVAAAKDRDLEWAANARVKARIEKLYELRGKRERRRAVTAGLDEVMRTFAGWYRDLAVVAAGADEAVLNHDFLLELRNEAFPGSVETYLAAVKAVRGTMERFRYNVDARCALEDMIFSIREALL